MYNNKYIKYKNKYINLIKQSGGISPQNITDIDNQFKMIIYCAGIINILPESILRLIFLIPPLSTPPISTILGNTAAIQIIKQVASIITINKSKLLRMQDQSNELNEILLKLKTNDKSDLNIQAIFTLLNDKDIINELNNIINSLLLIFGIQQVDTLNIKKLEILEEMVNIDKLKMVNIEKLKKLDRNELLKIVKAINWNVVLKDTANWTNILKNLKAFNTLNALKAFNTLNALKTLDAFNVKDLENIIKNIVKLYLNLNLNEENINNLIKGINTLGAKIKFKFELV